MEKHIRALGIVYLVYGLIALFVAMGFAGFQRGDVLLFSLMALILNVPIAIAGYGLVKFREWSRIFGIIISSLSLLAFPFGTAIGIYGLWVLTREESKALLSNSSDNLVKARNKLKGRIKLPIILSIIGAILGIPIGFIVGLLLGESAGYRGGDSIMAIVYAIIGIPIGMIILGSLGLVIGFMLRNFIDKKRNQIISDSSELEEEFDMESFNKGEDLYKSENYYEAFKYFIKVAQQGYHYAQDYIGYMFLTGQGVDQDNSEAFEWYQKAAIFGHAPSQYSLGYLYHYGRGVAKDLIKAKEWYQKVAEQNHEEAKQILNEIP